MPQPQPPKWHPLQSVRERSPGHWELYDQFGNKYADITLVRRNGQLGYRCLVLSPTPPHRPSSSSSSSSSSPTLSVPRPSKCTAIG